MLNPQKVNNAIPFVFDYSINYDYWKIVAWPVEEENNKNVYGIEIKLKEPHREILCTKRIELISKSTKSKTILALWKFLEKKIKELAYKDDLVQLFGYYQYKQDSEFIFNYYDRRLVFSNN